MRILIAPDSFKGSLSSADVATAMAAGIALAIPDAEIIRLPLADGGEGTLTVVQNACGGEVVRNILYDDDGCCALIESARCIALHSPAMPQNVFERGSTALGEAMCEALDAGAKGVRIALGGSATVDGGLGLLMALGCRVLDVQGKAVSADLNGLMQARQMDISGLDPRLQLVQITVLSDVQNPLCGFDGAVYVYGQQKGLEAGSWPAVDLAMQYWADLCERSFAVSVQKDAATGAAGGLGFALSLLGAKLVSGAEYIMQVSAFDQLLDGVDWLLTGEGCSDVQTIQGKLPWVVAQRARQSGVAVGLISGCILNAQDLAHIFDVTIATKAENISVAAAMRQAEDDLTQAAKRWAESIV